MVQFRTSDGEVTDVHLSNLSECQLIRELVENYDEDTDGPIDLPLIDSWTLKIVAMFGKYRIYDDLCRFTFQYGDGLETWRKLIIAADYLGYNVLHNKLGKVYANEVMDKTFEEFEAFIGRKLPEEARSHVTNNMRWSLKKKVHEVMLKKRVDPVDDLLSTIFPTTHRAFSVVRDHMDGYTWCQWSPNLAAMHGHLHVVRELRAHGEHCTYDGANEAANTGHLHVIQDLRAHGIHCTEIGADWSVSYGHLHVIQDLRAHGIHCTEIGADWAANTGRLHIVHDLRAHGIHCTSKGADWAAFNGNLNIIRDLREHGIHCTSKGADWAAASGRLHVVHDLRAHGIHCTSQGANDAASSGRLNVIRDLREHGIHCTPKGASRAAFFGHTKVVQYLKECGIVPRT